MPHKIEWLRLESRIREALRNSVRDGGGNIWNVSRDQAVCTLTLIDAIVADETRRGNVLNSDGEDVRS